MPACEMFRMLGSGTESVMAAIRGARAFTGKKWVVKVGGAYHGWSDQMVYGLHVPGTWRFEAKGIPFGATARTREVFPNDLDALRKKLKQNRLLGGTAAVIVEPVGPESGTRPVPFGFNAAVRELCDEFGALLIFDEVVSGFRLGMGGAQGYFGVRPDLTIFGKCITGGYPMAGGVGGRRDVMASFASGIGGKSGERAYIGGTLSANPLSCAAGYFAITEMERTGAPVLAGMAGDRLTAGLSRIIDKYDLPFVAYNQGSIVHLETSGVMLLDLKHPLRFAEADEAAQAHDRGDGRGLHRQRPDHARRLAHVHVDGRHRRGHRRRARALRARALERRGRLAGATPGRLSRWRSEPRRHRLRSPRRRSDGVLRLLVEGDPRLRRQAAGGACPDRRLAGARAACWSSGARTG